MSWVDTKRVDTKEFELPDTMFVSHIDAKVFQGIALQCLSQIDGIALVEGGFMSSFFGRNGPEVGCGVHSEQDSRNHSVSIKIEVNIQYGLSIPEKAEEIQTKVVEEITRLTGLHVSSVYVAFRSIIPTDQAEQLLKNLKNQPAFRGLDPKEEYSDEL
ncbi:MAG: Asp23/Gls24 family envelope stress response protein [Parachlamydiaceae bacterium]|nr:Asp23/Gls24 family envelope stress response protein [Parachlamydiaceae bacterium]